MSQHIQKLMEEFLFLTRVAIENGVIKIISKISLKPVDLFDCLSGLICARRPYIYNFHTERGVP